MKGWHIILLLIGLSVSFFFGYYIRSRCEKKLHLQSDTVIVVDTIKASVPIPSFEIEIGEVEIPYPIVMYQKGDTVRELDTIYVPVPITRKTYETEDYRAVISGFNPVLESMTIYHKKEIIYQKEHRFGIGIIGGYGIGKHGLSPYVGVGGFYRIW